MLYVKLLFSLAFVAFVAADDAELANLPPCAPCNRPRRDVDDTWHRPKFTDDDDDDEPTVTTKAPQARLPQPEAAEEDETVHVPGGNINANINGRPGNAVDGSVNVNVGGSGAQWPNWSVGLGSGDSDEEEASTTTTTTAAPRPPHRRPGPPGRPEGPRPGPPGPRRPRGPQGPGERPQPEGRRPGGNGHININWPTGWGSNNNGPSNDDDETRIGADVNVDGSNTRPDGNGGININWPTGWGSNNKVPRDDDDSRIGADVNIDGNTRPSRPIRIPSISWPGVNVNINGSNVRAPESNGNWNFTLPSLDFGGIRVPRIPSISVSGAANATKENMRAAGRVIGHFMKAVRNASEEITERMRQDQGLSDAEIQNKFADFGAELRAAARRNESVSNIMNRINDFVGDNNLTDIQEKYIKGLNGQISQRLPGQMGPVFENWLNNTGGWAIGVGKVEDVVATTDVDKVASEIGRIAITEGPEGILNRLRIAMTQLGLHDYFLQLSLVFERMMNLYLQFNPMLGLAMNLANSVGSMGLNMPSIGLNMPTIGLPGFDMITGLMQVPMNIAGSIAGFPSASGSANIQLPSMNGRMPELRIPSLNPSMRIPNVDMSNVNIPSGNPSFQIPDYQRPNVNVNIPSANPSFRIPDMNLGNVNLPSFNPNMRIPSMNLPNIRVPRVPDVNIGWGATVGGKGAGVSFGTDGLQVTRSGEPLMSSNGIIGNMLGDGMETIVKAPMSMADAMLRPMHFIPGVGLARNVLGSVSNMMG